jgi:RHS repeat-associated protein
VSRILPGENGEPDRRETTHMGYDAKGQSISSTDPMGRTTQTAYDALGRIESATDSAAGITAYTYSARDNLKIVTDANGHTHTFTYDRANRVKTEARPLGETITYNYDEVGNLTTRTSPQGERRVYTNDAAGRRTDENQFPSGSQAPSQTIVYGYDGRNLLTSYTQNGDTESNASYVYDAKGQKIDETVTYGSGPTAVTKTLHYGYEDNGLKKNLTYADGTIQTTTYDKNRLATITINGSTIQYQNYRWSVPTQIVMPGATRTLTYDPLQRPTAITSISAAGAVIMDYHYQYDAAGNISRRTTEDGDYLYSYDSLDRLTGATPPESVQQGPANPDGLPIERYTYDGVHNRKTSAHQPGPWTYNENNELQGYGIGAEEETYAYDANGNTRLQSTGNPQSPSRTREFIYNVAERLSEIKDNGATIAKYEYDPMGRRFRKEVNGTVTWFQYADEGLAAEFTSNGTLTRTYGWKPGNTWGTDPVWLADVSGSAWALNLYHYDHLGTSQRMTNVFGTVTWKAVSEAYGKTQVLFHAADNSLRFPGQLFDEESEQSYNFQRNYDPKIGRYLQADPIGLKGGANRFGYVDGRPIRHSDSHGEMTDKECCNSAQTELVGKNQGGGVFCCDGRQIPCARARRPGQGGDYITECIKSHEKDHIDNGDSEPCKQCPGFSRPPGSKKYESRSNESECRSTRKELTECLLPHYQSCERATDFACTSQIRTYYNGKIDDMKKVYNCPDLPEKLEAK